MREKEPSTRVGKTLYEVLGVPIGASADHIKDSYRLLSNKTSATDAAYETLTDPEMRAKYDTSFVSAHQSRSENRWGKRGRERCSCGRTLEVDDEWLCEECWASQVYFIVFDLFGARTVHQDDFLWPTADSDETSTGPTTLGPFTKMEAQQFLAEQKRLRDRGC
jgi:curved DNA-binding protein CbpA